MRAELHDVAVLDRPRLALVGVDDDVARPGLPVHRLPLDPRREAGAAEPRDPGGLELLDDRVRLGKLVEQLEAASRGVVVEGLVLPAEPDRRTVVRRVRDGGDDLVAARVHGREVAVPEAGDLDRIGVLREDVAAAIAVADGPGAHSHRVHGHLQERVERDELVHLAAADVHVVGDGIREVGRDGADLAADAAEVVEEARTRRGQRRDEARRGEDVHGAIVLRSSVLGGWPAELLRARAATLSFEPALARGPGWRRRHPGPRNRERLAQLVDKPIDRQLAVSQLASLVLCDRAENRPRALDHAPFLDLRERGRRIDVEERLHPRRGLLGVLAAGAARARDAQLDL